MQQVTRKFMEMHFDVIRELLDQAALSYEDTERYLESVAELTKLLIEKVQK